MTEWVRLCGMNDAPAEGAVVELEVQGTSVCLARVGNEFSALDNWCPHRQGPLGQGWIEGNAVICPWHSWAFNLRTGESEYPVNERVRTFPLRKEGDDLLVQIG